MRLPDSEHTTRPWRIHELTRDFRLEDVWALPTPGGPDDFPRLVADSVARDTSDSPSRAARALIALRWKIGKLLRWDDQDDAAHWPSLSDRLPADLRAAPGPGFNTSPFTPIYLLEDEFAVELSNRIVHAVMHVSWVEDGTGGYRGQLAVLVKPKGLLGTAYMAVIKPFRYLIVYPPMMRGIERDWLAGADGGQAIGASPRLG